MTTENQSVLEKLKRYKRLEDARAWDYPNDKIVEQWQDLHNWYCEAFKDRLIAAFEMVEAKAKRRISGESDFARELLAVVNGETKGE